LPGLTRPAKVDRPTLRSSQPSGEQQHNQNNQDDAADADAAVRTVRVIAAATPEKQKQYQNYKQHIFVLPFTVSSSAADLRWYFKSATETIPNSGV
jgi:hypothetical protein